MDREGKKYQDEMTVEKYRQELKQRRMPYGGVARARAINNRRARALALGECALQIMDKVRECSKAHNLMPGTLQYMIEETVVYPVAGGKEKNYDYAVMFQVYGTDPEFTEEEIEKECEDLTFRLAMETDEMFPENAEEEGESDGKKENPA